jgi:membrane-associated phospholipid phosphatase
MASRNLLWITAVCTALCVAAIAFIDRPLAEYIHRNGGIQPALFISGTVFVENVFGWQFSKYLLGFIVAGAGLVISALKGRNRLAGVFVIVGVSHLSGRLTAGVLKNVFERLRPEELIQAAQSTGFFAADGNSFPSAHVAHFWSLFFPLALFCKPIYWPCALLIPVFIAVSRVAVNHHFVSDVFAGIGVAAFVTWCVQHVLQGRYGFSTSVPTHQETAARADLSHPDRA